MIAKEWPIVCPFDMFGMFVSYTWHKGGAPVTQVALYNWYRYHFARYGHGRWSVRGDTMKAFCISGAQIMWQVSDSHLGMFAHFFCLIQERWTQWSGANGAGSPTHKLRSHWPMLCMWCWVRHWSKWSEFRWRRRYRENPQIISSIGR